MNQTLQMGANTVLNSPMGQVSISYEVSSAIDISLTAFLLTDSDLVQGDNGIISVSYTHLTLPTTSRV